MLTSYCNGCGEELKSANDSALKTEYLLHKISRCPYFKLIGKNRGASWGERYLASRKAEAIKRSAGARAGRVELDLQCDTCATPLKQIRPREYVADCECPENEQIVFEDFTDMKPIYPNAIEVR